MFYLLAYGFTTVAVFGIISLVRTGDDGEARTWRPGRAWRSGPRSSPGS